MINLINKIYKGVIYLFSWDRIVNTISFYLTKPEKRLLLNIWVKSKKGRLVHNNWGDDINYYFFKEITRKKIFNLSNMISYLIPHSINNILTIGSIIEMRCRNNSIIWGSGMMYGNVAIKPQKVFAVRGPLTREILLKNGIECPEIYGDPALLLPLHYQPKVEKKYKIGIIPHYKDLDNKFINEFISVNDGVVLINLKQYKHWHDIPNLINECEFILSSSLHGLIISDAYNIPNIWVSFSDKIPGGNFKFLDYFYSVNRFTENPIIINQSMKIETFLKLKEFWKPISFNPEPLIKSCPFEIKLGI